MAPENLSLGFYPPRQARSRAALQRILTSAEQVLADTSFDDLTIAEVAERAGLSVGAIYRRFESKEQLLSAVKDRLLSRVEDDIAAALDATCGGLAEVIDAFTHALADAFSAGAHVIPNLAEGAKNIGTSERSRWALENIQRLFLDATTAHLDQVRRSDPTTALSFTFRTMTAAGIHRTITWQTAPDGMSWEEWSEQVADMATLYLTTPDPANRPA